MTGRYIAYIIMAVFLGGVAQEGKMDTRIPTFKAKKPLIHSRHPRRGYVVRGRIWVEKDGELYVEGGRVVLLERIAKLGSIAAAARSMGLGYRNAWLWVAAMNRLAPSLLVEKATGGANGGYARLTDEGRKVVAEYREMNSHFQDVLKNEI